MAEICTLMFFIPFVFAALAHDIPKFPDNSTNLTFSGEAANKLVNLLTEGLKCLQREKTCKVNRPSECNDLDRNSCKSGVYRIFPRGKYRRNGLLVYCEMNEDDGGWIVIQRRMNGVVSFYRNWKAYKDGFGNMAEEFWLGNDKLHQLTRNGNFKLLINLKDFRNSRRFAMYDKFIVGNHKSSYKLTLGTYTGDAGNAFGYHSGQKFSTYDKDNDVWGGNCAKSYGGGWWYGACHSSNLNGLYLKGSHSSYANGVNWRQWKGYHYSMKEVTMMIKQR